jgi:uncharacterized membrane protein (UPF0127 family)
MNTPMRLPLILGLLISLTASGWTQAQPKLGTIPLTLGKQTVTAEVAATADSMMRGLMFRKDLGANEGMLFVYPQPQKVSFWMKNTSLPLSIAYIDALGVIVEIYDLEPFNENSVESKSDRIQYTLEMNRDWFASHGIKPGTKIEGLPRFAQTRQDM